MTNPDGSPAHGVPVEIKNPNKDQGSKDQGQTSTRNDGVAMLTMNTPKSREPLTITVSPCPPGAPLQRVGHRGSLPSASSHPAMGRVGPFYLHKGTMPFP